LIANLRNLFSFLFARRRGNEFQSVKGGQKYLLAAGAIAIEYVHHLHGGCYCTRYFLEKFKNWNKAEYLLNN
jgi:hypothetical protein